MVEFLGNAALLARLQFFLTISFHYLFPPLTIGLGLLMVMTEGLFLKTGNQVYEGVARFLTKLFAVTFAMGVVTGITMEFQFGTNWAAYSRFVGDVFGSALAAEAVLAFFLESAFLAILVFGWDRVSPRMHFFSTCMVFLGSMLSAVWIVVANSWQQTPAGYHLVETAWGMRAEITDFWAMVFNPSSLQRLSHTLIGAFMQGTFFVLGVCAWHLIFRPEPKNEWAKKTFVASCVLALGLAFVQLIAGHAHAVQVAQTQPGKLATFEGLYQTHSGGAPLAIFGIPNDKEQRLDYAVTIPNMLSLLVHGDLTTPVPGLDTIPVENRPPMLLTYFSFHAMLALWGVFVAMPVLGLGLYKLGWLWNNRLVLWAFLGTVPLVYAANQLGWIAAEVGRQPWVVWNMLRTSDAVSTVVTPSQIITTILMFGAVYACLFILWFWVVCDIIRKGPQFQSEDVHA